MKKTTLIIGLFGAFLISYILLVWQIYRRTGIWHYNLFSYFGTGEIIIAVVAVCIALIIGKLKI